MSIVRRGAGGAQGEAFDEDEDAQVRRHGRGRQEEGSLALRATGAVSDDGIIDPRDTRTVLGHVPVGGPQPTGRRRSTGYGVFRL